MSQSQARERNWNQNNELLVQAAQHVGIDPRIMVKIAGFESNFNTGARPVSTSKPHLNTVRQWDGTMAISSAYGLGQFLDGTWLDMVRRHGEKHGVANADGFTRAQANAPGIRDNPRLQAAMLAEFTRDNLIAGALLGGPEPDANVYAMHNLGATDARTFLSALRVDPNQRMDRVLSARVISGNPALYGDGSLTVAQAYRAMGRHMDAYALYADRVPSVPNQPAAPGSRIAPAGSDPIAPPAPRVPHAPHSAIYDEAHRHFLRGGNRFEYGRGDKLFSNAEGTGRTDSSRNERDNDRDGLRGVDCSSFVWRALANAGYNVPPNSASNPFTTHDLFNGRTLTQFARHNFDIISGADARPDRGSLQMGDLLLFKDKNSGGQHVGIFKGYDAAGRIEFIGSQVSTGPAQVRAGQGSYWNGGEFEIVGALRVKPEFQVRAPLHADPRQSLADATPGTRAIPASTPSPPRPTSASRPADADGVLELGEKGPAVTTLQQRLADLGYQAPDGKPLRIDGDFGTDTRDALVRFQRDHGLQGKGVAGDRTELALDRAERVLMAHPSHPHHALYAQVLERVHAGERAKGQEPGHHSQRIAAALAVECLREGIARVDRVEHNRDATIVRGVQVSAVRDEPGLNRTTDGISVAQAAQQTLRESSEQIHQVAVNRQAQVRDEQQRLARPAPAMAP